MDESRSQQLRRPAPPLGLVLPVLCALAAVLAVAVAAAGRSADVPPDVEWPAYGSDPGGSHHSAAGEITPANVERLEVAWTYRTGDLVLGEDGTRFEATPVMLAGTLYLSTPLGRVIALDPASGAERWSYDPRIDLEGSYGDFTNRGVAVWLDAEAAAEAPCRRRVFVAPIDARLIALDAATGRPCAGFGDRGEVDLARDLVHEPLWHGEYQVTSPPVVAGGVVAVGSAIADNQRVNAPSGAVQAFDPRTGAPRWRWDPVPRNPDDPARATWGGDGADRNGAANAWAPIAADAERGLLFVPVGSASPDFYGGERPGANLYANSLVALRAATGERVWHFQTVHHDLWDYDVPAQPVLFTLRRGGREVPAVAQVTKVGHLFVLDRETGEPLLPVEERPVPASDVAGERASPTQPFPLAPPPLAPHSLAASEAWGVSAADRAWCRRRIAELRNEGVFTPPSLRGSLLVPGNIGGSHWGGAAVDPARVLLITPTNRLPTVVTLVPKDGAARRSEGGELASQRGTPYRMHREMLFGPSRLPCNPPPWGALTAVDLAAGEIRWEVPLGSMAPPGTPGAEGWGSVQLGGAITTAAGLTFIAATFDRHLRAFATATGEELWRGELPAAGNATPMTYTLGGRQYVVIAAGGHARAGTALGDHVVAFALPAGDGVPRSEPEPSPAGRWRGEAIAGRERLDAELQLEVEGTAAAGRLRLDAGRIDAPLTGEVTGPRLSLRVVFHDADLDCDLVVSGGAEVANRGTLLDGRFEVAGEGGCGGGEVRAGTLALRRVAP